MNNTKIKILFSIVCVSLIQINLYSDHIVKKANESKITDSDYSETDPEIIVNPLDENNLINSSIQHKLTYGRDNFVNAISYSFDKGLTWHRYKELITPNDEIYRIVTDASDNKLIFDNNGVAHLAWLNTIVKTGYGGIDSVVQKVIYRYSDDKGVNWNNIDYDIGRINSNYDINKKKFGLKEYFKNLKLLNYNNEIYLSYSVHGINDDYAYIRLINLKSPNNITKITLPDSIDYLSSYDIKIKDEKAYIVFLSHNNNFWYLRQTLNYFTFGLNIKENIYYKKIDDINYMGSTYLPGTVRNIIIPGVAVELISPAPKINFIKDTALITWSGSTYSSRYQKNNLFICKGVNNEFEKPRKIYEDSINHQMNYDIKINDNNVILIHFYNLLGPDYEDNINYDVEPKILFSFDNGNTFSEPHSYSSKIYKINSTIERNFNYGIGYKTSVDLNNSDIFLTWTDGRFGDGNTEIFSAVYPIYYDFEKLFISKSINIEVNSLYPNPFNNKICVKIKNLKLQRIVIDLYDFNGKLVSELYNNIIKVGDNELILNVEKFAEGNYFIKFRTEEDNIIKKIIKVH